MPLRIFENERNKQIFLIILTIVLIVTLSIVVYFIVVSIVQSQGNGGG